MNAGAPDDGAISNGLEGFDADALVAAALEDDQLREAAAEAGLQPKQIAYSLHGDGQHWRHAGQVDTRGRIDEAQRRLNATAERRERLDRTPRWLYSYYAVAIAFGVLMIIGAVDTGESVGMTALVVAVALSPLAAIGYVISLVRARRRAELDEELHATVVATDKARDELERELTETVVKPLIRAELNARRGSRYDTTTGPVESEGLAEILDPKYLISTDAARRLDRFLKDMPGGSIGLSGPRGAGKSSLIQAKCPSVDNQPEGLLGVVVSAPVEFEPREFVLHLFSELCMAVLGRDSVERLRNPRPRPRATTGLAWALVGSALMALAGLALMAGELIDKPSNIALGAVVTGVGIASGIVLLVLKARAVRGPLEQLERLWELRVAVDSQRFSTITRATAERQLRAIWFQQTFSEGWSGALKLPGGLQGGVEGGQELARQQMSMPDIVSELRRLIGTVTENGRVRVRIGIDELDKIDSPEHAARFFNEIKVLFGIPDCFFLVSVSEDALASFERRGMPVRDVFDSSFDDVIRLEHLRAHDSIAMLRERVVGMPMPFLLLCHCLSGGLPRDLIRSARDLVSLVPEQETGGAPAELRLSSACIKLVADQLSSKAGGVATTARRSLSPHEAVAIRDLADRLSHGSPDATELHAYAIATADELKAMAHDRSFAFEAQTAMASFAAELATFAYFCATLLELFDDARPMSHFATDIHQEDGTPQSGRSVVDQLAYARQAFAIHPRAAWSAITGARLEAGSAHLPDYPFPTVLTVENVEA